MQTGLGKWKEVRRVACKREDRFHIEQFDLGKLKVDIRSRVVYIKNRQLLYLQVEL